jgi:lipoprotein-anchoring transpeptidase ErfK/SrfK
MTDTSPASLPLMARRAFLIGAASLLTACEGNRFADFNPGDFGFYPMTPADLARYASTEDNGHTIEALDLNRVERRWLRQHVNWSGREAPGTVVVDPGERYLYIIEGRGRAMRYGVGVGREGFGWTGTARVGGKAVWPTWTPPKEMQARDPEARKYAGGMPGGVDNPLGARALYLFEGGRDTLYRIHGTTEPYTIGTKVSSGCIRMFNHDVIDVYNRVPSGATVIVLPTNLL